MLAKFFLIVIRRFSSFVTRPEKFLFLALNIVAVNRLEVVAHGNFYPAVVFRKLYTFVRLVNVAKFALQVVADNEKRHSPIFIVAQRKIYHRTVAA